MTFAKHPAVAVLGLVTLALGAHAPGVEGQDGGAALQYQRAEQLLTWNAEPLARDIVEEVEWLGDSDRS